LNTAFVLINCYLGQEDNVVDYLKNILHVHAIQKTFGASDVVVTLKAENNDKLKETSSKIRETRNIAYSMTLFSTQNDLH
jgi:hypothetical protein